MDILAHMLWTNYGTRVVNKKLIKKKKEPIKIIPMMIWSIFPDLFAFGIPTTIAIFLSLWTRDFNWKLLLDHHLASGFLLSDLPKFLYQFSHSLVIWFLVFSLVWIIAKKPQLLLFGWLFHILIDIFSHSVDFYPTPIFFPISNWHFAYGIRWSNPYFMLVNYSLIVIVGIYLYIKEKKKI